MHWTWSAHLFLSFSFFFFFFCEKSIVFERHTVTMSFCKAQTNIVGFDQPMRSIDYEHLSSRYVTDHILYTRAWSTIPIARSRRSPRIFICFPEGDLNVILQLPPPSGVKLRVLEGNVRLH